MAGEAGGHCPGLSSTLGTEVENVVQVIQVVSRRELERRIRQAVLEQRASERRFRKAWRKMAGESTWRDRLVEWM